MDNGGIARMRIQEFFGLFLPWKPISEGSSQQPLQVCSTCPDGQFDATLIKIGRYLAELCE